MPAAHLRAVIATLSIAYSGLIGASWLHTGSLHAAAFSMSCALGLAWVAGLAAEVWILTQGWVLVGAAVLAWTVKRRDAAQVHVLRAAEERLEELQHQAAGDLTHMEGVIAGMKHRLDRYRALQAVAQSLNRAIGVHAVAQLMVTQAVGMVGKSSTALLLLLDRATQSLVLTASHRVAHAANIAAKQGDAFDAAVLRSRRGLIVDDVIHDARYACEDFRDRSVHALVATPLVIDQRVEGVLRLESDEAAAYAQEDLRLLDLVAELGAAAIATARLYMQTRELAMTDGLTGALVRRALVEGMHQELLRAERRQEARALLMIDIDHFKRYNDALGHAAGDLVLKGVARLLKEQAGPDGLVARYGGEEFTVLLGPMEPHEAAARSERIRRAVAEEPFVLRREITHVTISIGVAHYPIDGREPIELLRVADDRLYRAKQAGRNRVWAA